ncbi:MAG: hypothetical protein PVH37_27110 [Desulfobacterales bacterium]
MLSIAGLGIAFHAKPIVKKKCPKIHLQCGIGRTALSDGNQ